MNPADRQRIRQALAHFLETSTVSCREIAGKAGIDPSQLGRFLKGESGLSDERLTQLEAAIQKLAKSLAPDSIIPPGALQDLVQALREDRLTLFVGAGISRQAVPPRNEKPLPLWGELATRLVTECLGESKADELRELPPLDQLDYLQAEGCKDHVVRLLRDQLLNDHGYRPSPAHLALKSLPWRVVITTNYDGLLGDRDVLDVRYPVVTERDFVTHDPRKIKLVHLNGDLREPHTLFSSDYHAWAVQHPRAHAFLRQAVSPPNRALFVGYSFSDPFLTELLADVREMSTREGFQNIVHAWMWRLDAPKKLLLKHRYNVEAQSIAHDAEWERAFLDLSAAFEKLSGRALEANPPAASSALRQKFLDLQRQTYERATLAGLYVGESYRAEDVLLENVFVQPSLCLTEDEEKIRVKNAGLRAQRLSPDHAEEWIAPHGCRDAYDWLDAKEHPQLVIIGDPGTGKSTLLQMFMLAHLAAWAADPTQTFPVYLRLSVWEKERLPGKSLLDYALHLMSQCLGLSDVELLRPWLAAGPVHWLLDGVDEVRDPGARVVLLDELEKLRARHPMHRWAVTTRPSGYRDSRLPEPWLHVRLAPLDDKQGLAVLGKWSALLQSLHKLARPLYDPEDLFADLGSKPGLSPLRRNPLLLTMIVLFYRDHHTLPAHRWDFYDHATKSLRMRWVRHRSGPFSKEQVRIASMAYYDTLLPLFGIEAMRLGTAVLSREQTADILKRVLKAHDFTGREVLEETDAFFSDAIALIGVLVERGPDRYGFLHLTFQEFYAAKWLISHEKEAAELMKREALNPDWIEVWELYVLGLESNEARLDALHDAVGTKNDAIDLEGMKTRLRWLGLGSAPIPPPEFKSGGRARTHDWGKTSLASTAMGSPSPLAAVEALAQWEREYPPTLRDALLERLGDADNQQAHTTAKALGERSEGRELRLELMRILCTTSDERTRGFAEFALMQKADNPLVRRALLSLYRGTRPEGITEEIKREARLAAARALGGSEPAVPLWEPDSHTTKTVQLTPEVSLTFVLIPKGRIEAEGHVMKIDADFWLAQTQVTQAQWQAVMGENPSHFKGPHLPVECVSWDEITKGFHVKLAALIAEAFGAAARIHLPTEAQWEYACRASTQTPFNNGADRLGSHEANFDGNYPFKKGDAKGVYRERTVVVGSFKANKYGLHDMHGNVWEWCDDYWADKASKDYTPPKTGSLRVLRGGSFANGAGSCRSSFRNRVAPDYRSNFLGFRPAVSIGEVKPAPEGKKR